MKVIHKVIHEGKVEADLIPEWAYKCMANYLIPTVIKYFEDPENVRKYEEWLKTKNDTKQ